MTLLFWVNGLIASPSELDSVYFGSIEITSETDEIDLTDIRRKYRKLQVNENNYNSLTAEILLNLKMQGYYFAVINLKNTNVTQSSDSILLNPEFVLNYNEIARIDTFYFEGLNKTDPLILNRELKHYKGKIVSDPLISRIKRQVARFKFLEIKDQHKIVRDRQENLGLLFQVIEKNNNNFQGIAGYVPGKGEEKGYFTGKFDITLSNLAGMGRRLNLNWSRLNRNSQEFHIDFYTPWIWKYNYSGQLSFDQTLRDTTLVTRNFQTSVGKQFSPALSLQLNFEFESHLPTPSGRELYNLQSSTNRFAGAGIRFDTRQPIYNPRSGGTLNSDIMLGNTETSENIILNLDLSTSYNLSIVNNLVVHSALNFQGRWQQNQQYDYSDYFWFGGAQSMRGYAEDFFRGTKIGWATLELRWLQGLYSSLYLFYERGYFYFTEDGAENSGYPASFGAGIRLNSRAGIIGLDYAFDEDDSFTTAKIHLHFINRF
ncbi:MAG TPA: hypothetical protein VKP78_10480 [bacterium]|nr:hypothetical protein [bacterium]